MAWMDGYRGKVTTAEKAVACVRSGDHVWLHAGCNNPEELVKALVARSGDISDVEVTHLLTFGAADHVDPSVAGSFRHRALFTGPNVRQAVNEGSTVSAPTASESSARRPPPRALARWWRSSTGACPARSGTRSSTSRA
jgi:4-hydroxybutyrate CoA-transferase